MVERICGAARQLFSERGYHGATTREIARVADVSETLLFRYYGSKAALFDEVVCAPFNQIMQTFLQDWRELSQDDLRKTRQHHIFLSISDLFEQNRTLFTALLSARGMDPEDTGPLPFNSLLAFFREGAREQLVAYDERGEKPTIDVGLGVRLAFGMLAASVLFDDWLFPDGRPPQAHIVHTLETMVSRALDPSVAR